MPEQPNPEQKPVNKPSGKPTDNKPESKPVPDKKVEPKKKTPAQEKDDTLKYEMKYVNGGFNNGVQIKPDKNGKALIEISIYGGGEKKTLSVGPLPGQISKLIKAYEISANQGSETPEITTELQKWFEQVNTRLSQKVIQILSEADAKVATAIKKSIRETK